MQMIFATVTSKEANGNPYRIHLYQIALLTILQTKETSLQCRMKRPPGLWLLLSAGVLWLCVQNVHGVKATSLIFGKTTTSTTAPEAEDASLAASGEETPSTTTNNSTETTDNSTSTNTTKPTLTGIPQIDYIWDPNLPRELNGYNLSDYPFYDRVPEDIDFKCDGLHDGFYASVPHKCQVYHHCLFGTRYDFLCANYTAFDQKTFICHFVSEVDCVNSKKFWHRNDALYKAATTTTTTIKPPAILYTPPPQQQQQQPQVPAAPPRRPVGSRRRPLRRRPQYDYYDYEEDDYYEDTRARRPRPRPRPLYDDDYEEYEEDRIERRRPNRRRPYYESRRRPGNRKRNKNEGRKQYEDEEEEDYEAPRHSGRRDEVRPKGKKQATEEDDYERPRKTYQQSQKRRPVEDDVYYDEEPVVKRTEDKPKMLVKPVSGSSVYDKPRAPPRIRPPVPKNEQEKFAYKHMAVESQQKPEAEEYYDEYEEEVVQEKASKPSRKNEESRPKLTEREEENQRSQSQSRPRGFPSRRPNEDEEEEEEERPIIRRPSNKRNRPKHGANRYGRLGHKDDYEEEYEDLPETEEKIPETKPQEVIKPTTTTVAPEVKETLVRVLKRPFLPSRGGNPYASRGLKPVGLKATEEDEPSSDKDDLEHLMRVTQKETTTEPPKPTQNPPKKIEEPVEPPLHTITTRPHVKYKETPEEPIKVTPLEDTLNESEYDVTLNDALNPTLPNLPVRAFPTGFSAGADYRRHRYQEGGEGYQVKLPPPVATYPAAVAGRQFLNRNADYVGQYSTLAGLVFRSRAG